MILFRPVVLKLFFFTAHLKKKNPTDAPLKKQ